MSKMAFMTNGPYSPKQPYIEIVEQPKKKALRFRYPTESRKAGNIYGEHHTDSCPRFPAIRVCNMNGPIRAMMFCVTSQGEIHPHKLVGENCIKEGICILDVESIPPQGAVISFNNVGVQCCKRDDISKFLEEKKPWIRECAVPKNLNSTDLTSVCLMFRVMQDDHNICTAISRPIIDKKHCSDLTIVRVSARSSPADGNNEIFILCNKVKKDDIEVVFSSGTWEGHGAFVPTDVFKECAIVCRVPSFHDSRIEQSVEVSLTLRERSSKETGDPVPFTYTPVNTDRYGIRMKRKVLMNYNQTQPFNSNAVSNFPISNPDSINNPSFNFYRSQFKMEDDDSTQIFNHHQNSFSKQAFLNDSNNLIQTLIPNQIQNQIPSHYDNELSNPIQSSFQPSHNPSLLPIYCGEADFFNLTQEEKDRAHQILHHSSAPPQNTASQILSQTFFNQKEAFKSSHHPSSQVQSLNPTHLQPTNLQPTNLQQTNLQPTNLQQTNLQPTNLQQTNLQPTNLQPTNLQQTNLQPTHLQQNHLQQANLQPTHLQPTNLQQNNPQSTNLQPTNLQQTNLQPTHLQQTNLQQTNLQPTHLQSTLPQNSLDHVLLENSFQDDHPNDFLPFQDDPMDPLTSGDFREFENMELLDDFLRFIDNPGNNVGC